MTEDELIKEFTDFAKHDIESAITVVTGLFVSLNLVYVEMRGADPKNQIDIVGDEGQRKITIHKA